MNDIFCIPVTQGKVAIVDVDDARYVSGRPWFAIRDHRTFYAGRTLREPGKKKRTQRLHALLMPECKRVDHINGNGLDNRRCNLRPATRSQNGGNRGKQITVSASKFKGVSRKNGKWKLKWRWQAYIGGVGRRMHLGYFTSELEAARAYDAAAVRLFGEFARTNKMLGLLE